MLTDKSILITGAASGIGAAAARAFHAHGAKLTLLDRSDAVHAVAEALGALGVIADITDAAAIRAAVEAAVVHHGRLDGAFNNAGTEQRGGAMIPLDSYPLDDFDRVLGINLRGTLICMQAELAVMIPAARGAIVNTASVLGHIGAPGMAAYVTSKHGVIGITRVAALEHAKGGIRVNAVLPGPVSTPMLTERAFPVNPGYEEAVAEITPIGRIARAEEIAEAAAWLLSDYASYVTGLALPVDGGMSAR